MRRPATVISGLLVATIGSLLACNDTSESATNTGGTSATAAVTTAATTAATTATNANATTGTGTPQPVTTQENLRDQMRQLWTEHVTWTRVFLIDAVAGLADTPQTTTRLLQNQVDLGNAIKPFYGDAAGNQLTQLLHDHILGAAAVVAAAKSGNTAALTQANDAWYANADQIAMFLSSANPNWAFADLDKMMHDHLDATLTEAKARLTQDWSGDVTAYDNVVNQILGMSDMLATGIASQFPDKVAAQTTPTAEENLHVAMRKLWEDHTTWTRIFIIDDISGLPDLPQATARLLKNQADIGDAVKLFYGDAAGAKLTDLLKQHILGAAAVVNAAKANDQAGLQMATAAWYANAHDIAVFLSQANPNWRLSEIDNLMKAHLDQTTMEAVDRLQMKYEAEISAYDMVENHILGMADFLSDGIDKQFPGTLGVR